MYSTTDFKKGLKIEHNGKPFVIVNTKHVAPGKGAAFVKTRLKNLETGAVLDVTFKSGEKVGVPDLDFRDMQYLYNDGNGTYTFMDTTSYEQFELSDEEFGDAKDYVVENGNCRVTFYENRAVAVEIENFVDLKVAETQPNIKGDTSSGGGKPATLETGKVVTVPFHINEGDLLKIDTRTNTYIEKVGKK